MREAFGVKWRKAPAYTTIRGILRQLDPASVEAAFRRHAAVLNDATNGEGQPHVAIDGKTLRRSFDNFLDRRAAHILSAFASDKALVLGHLDCGEKSNEIPAVQTLHGGMAVWAARRHTMPRREAQSMSMACASEVIAEAAIGPHR